MFSQESEEIYGGQCQCGSEPIQFELEGDPAFAQYCHCSKCRSLTEDSKNPQDKMGYGYTVACLNEKFKIVQGKEKLEQNSKDRENAYVYLCGDCHSLIYGIAKDPKNQLMIGINGSNFNLPEEKPEAFKAKQHIWYENRMEGIHDRFKDDGLKKYMDAPEGPQGGTGKLFEEPPRANC